MARIENSVSCEPGLTFVEFARFEQMNDVFVPAFCSALWTHSGVSSQERT